MANGVSGQAGLPRGVVQPDLQVLGEDEEDPGEAGEVHEPDARAEHVGADPEEREVHHRFAVAPVAALVEHPEAEQHGGEGEERGAERAVPGALLDERDEQADHGRAEEHDAERVEGRAAARAGGSGAGR